MRARQIIEGASYGPDQLRVLGQAFDAAWAQIAGNLSGQADGVEAARLKLAMIILSLAGSGMPDASQLTKSAVQMMYEPPVKLRE